MNAAKFYGYILWQKLSQTLKFVDSLPLITEEKVDPAQVLKCLKVKVIIKSTCSICHSLYLYNTIYLDRSVIHFSGLGKI